MGTYLLAYKYLVIPNTHTHSIVDMVPETLCQGRRYLVIYVVNVESLGWVIGGFSFYYIVLPVYL